MNKNIVVFGCDNSGKTTFCENLKKYLTLNYGYFTEIEVVHSIGANKCAMEYIDFMAKNLSKNRITIFDRFPVIEEETVGLVLRGKSVFHEEKYVPITDECLKAVDLFVFCFPGIEPILNWGNREQMEGIKENVLKIIPLYISYALALKKYNRKVIEYNYIVEKSERDFSWDSESIYWNDKVSDILKGLDL